MHVLDVWVYERIMARLAFLRSEQYGALTRLENSLLEYLPGYQLRESTHIVSACLSVSSFVYQP